MAQSRRLHLKSLLAVAAMAGGPALAADNPLLGIWSGKLVIGSASLRLRFTIGADTASSQVISLDQGNAVIPASALSLTPDSVTIAFAMVNASYTGKLRDNDHIDGTFTQNGNALPLSLARGEIIEEARVVPLTLPLLQSLRAQAKTPAIGTAWQGPKGQSQLCDGLRAADGAAKVTDTDQWHWGSITKSMTATLVARLVEAGAVKWDVTVGEVLGAKAPAMQAAYRDATFKHLLSHRAGLQPNIDMTSLVTYSRDPLPDARAERLKYAAEALGQAPVGPLVAQMVYSNNGFVVAGAMLEAITGQSWEDLIQAHVFTPLKLASAGFGAPGHTGENDQPLGHAIIGDVRQPLPVGPGIPNDNPVALAPAGRVHMSLPDMLIYLQAHRDQPGDFLKADSWKTLHTPPFGGEYALGWVVRPDGAMWHNGSNTAWYGEILVDKTAGVVCAASGNDGSPATTQAVGQILLSARQAAL